MIIAVIGDMNPRQQVVIDKIISDGHEVVYIGKDDAYGGIAPDICIVDEYPLEAIGNFNHRWAGWLAAQQVSQSEQGYTYTGTGSDYLDCVLGLGGFQQYGPIKGVKGLTGDD